jgi:MFS family permease
MDDRAIVKPWVDYDDAPLRLFHLRVAVASSGGVFSDGYGLGIIGISLSHAPPQLGLNPVWLGLLGGASLLGLFAGALLTGPAADRFGRRPIFACNMAILGALSLLQGLADSAAMLLALRLAIGFLLGTDYVVSKALLTEFTPRRVRGRILGLLSVAWAGGYVAPPSQIRVPPASRGRWHQLLSTTWRIRTLVGCAFFTCQVIPYFAVGTFVSQVMSAMSVKSGYVGGLIYNVSLLGGAVGGLIVVDRLPRRTFLIGSFVISAAAMLILSLWSDIPAVAMIILFALFAGVLSAASNLVYVYLPELFPTDLRASGIGLAIAASRTGSAISTFLLPIIVAAYGVRTALGACVAILAAGAVICRRWAPETRNVSLGTLDAPPG